MARVLAVLSTVIGLVVFATPASAADGCGRGWYWNGYGCAPMGRYGPPPGYAGNTRGADCYNYHGRRICCPHNWTIQDGACKPYRGF